VDLPPLVRTLTIAVVLLVLVVGSVIAIRTEPPGYEACGPQPITEASQLKENANCKTVAPIHSTAE
jgi:hypothetical protein